MNDTGMSGLDRTEDYTEHEKTLGMNDLKIKTKGNVGTSIKQLVELPERLKNYREL